MEKDEFDAEISNKELVLEILRSSKIPLLYKTEDIQNILHFTEERLKLTTCQSHEMFLTFVRKKFYWKPLNILRVSDLLIADGETTKISPLEQFIYIPNFFYTDYGCYNLGNRQDRKN